MNLEAIRAILRALSWILLSDVVSLRPVGPFSAGDQSHSSQAPPARPNVDVFLKEGRHDMTPGYGRCNGTVPTLVTWCDSVHGVLQPGGQERGVWGIA